MEVEIAKTCIYENGKEVWLLLTKMQLELMKIEYSGPCQPSEAWLCHARPLRCSPGT